MKNIYNNGLRIIYLDQFASVGLFESELKEWKKVRELIATGVNSNKAICPLSFEHYIETSQKEKTKAVSLDSEFYKISGGYALKPELFITSQLIISLIRKNNITLKTYMYDDIYKNVLSDSINMNVFIDAKKKLNENISEATSIANEIRKINRETKPCLKEKQLITSACKSISVYEFISRLEDLLIKGYVKIRGVSFSSGNVPNWIDQTIFQLTNNKKMTPKEARNLIVEFERHGFDNIPTLDIRTSLSTIISVMNKNETVNDQVDIMRIASGLPVSDIFLTDKQRKKEIIELGLDKKYHTKIYTGTIRDLEEFISELEEII